MIAKLRAHVFATQSPLSKNEAKSNVPTVTYPFFGHQMDIEVSEVLNKTFPNKSLEFMECKDLAINGGVLNCITWNIYCYYYRDTV
jgi:hypothetical protein